MDMEETTVQLWPPHGAGSRIGESPKGQVVVESIGPLEYTNVTDLHTESKWISFTTRTGDKISSTLPYIVRVVKVPAGNA